MAWFSNTKAVWTYSSLFGSVRPRKESSSLPAIEKSLVNTSCTLRSCLLTFNPWRSADCSLVSIALISHRLDQMYLCEGSFIILESVKSWKKNGEGKRACGSGTQNTKLESLVIRKSSKKACAAVTEMRACAHRVLFSTLIWTLCGTDLSWTADIPAFRLMKIWSPHVQFLCRINYT